MSRIITTSYPGPDLDGYSCAVAYAHLLKQQGKDAHYHIDGEPHPEVKWVLKTYGIKNISTAPQKSDAVILLDASSPEDLPSPIEPDQVIEVIDHRKIHQAESFVNAAAQIEEVGAAATLIAEKYKQEGISPSKEDAILLYGGIISNTQNFSSIATTRDKEMASWLKEVASISDSFIKEMFNAKSDLEGETLHETLENDTKTIQLGSTKILIAQLEIIGVQSLIENRKDELLEILHALAGNEGVEYAFINMKDLQTMHSKILCLNNKTAGLLAELPGATWSGDTADSSTHTLRKQLITWINQQQ